MYVKRIGYDYDPLDRTITKSERKAIHAQEDREAAQKKAKDVAAKLRQMKLSKVAEMVEQDHHETLRYYIYPQR